MRGVIVSNEVTVDWAEIGAEFAQVSSKDQAAFLTAAVAMFNSIPELQIAYLADDINNDEVLWGMEGKVARFLESLSAFLLEASTR